MLCGDEIRALVADLGSSSCRFGSAGQDLPRHVFRTDVGTKTVLGSSDNSNSSNSSNSSSSNSDSSMKVGVSDASQSSSAGGKKFVIGDVGLRYFDPNVEVINPLSGNVLGSAWEPGVGGGIQWDAVEAILRNGAEATMRDDTSEIPVIMTESKFHSTKDKAKLAEIIFESMTCPSWYMGANAMFSSFSAGHPTSLVIDLGGSGMQIVPVVDGFPIRRSTFTSNKGGNMLDNMIKDDMLLRAQSGVHLKCFFDRTSIYSNIGNNNSSSSSSNNSESNNIETPNDGTSMDGSMSLSASASIYVPSLLPVECMASYRNYHLREIHRDIKQWMCFVPYNPLLEGTRVDFFSKKINIPPYVLPDGTQVTLSENLCSIPERLLFLSPTHPVRPWNSLVVHNQSIFGIPSFSQPIIHDATYIENATLTALVHASVSRADVDIRKDLLSKLIIVGGTSLIDGVKQRLQYELEQMLSSQFRIKVVSQQPAEKLNAAWIGASITSICGTFQQLWISSQEYSEYGGERIVADKLNHCLFS